MSKNINEDYFRQKYEKTRVNPIKQPIENATTKALKFNLEGLNLDRIDISDIQQVIERSSYYFERCVEEEIKPGIAGLCVWIGINRNTWYDWVNGKSRKETHQAACVVINQIFDAQLEQEMMNGKINPVPGIFMMRNNFGYTNEDKIVVETKDSKIKEMTMDEVLKLAESNNKK